MRALRLACLPLAALALAGCAELRWLDRRTSGDLTGVQGRDMGVIEVLGGPEAEEGREKGDGKKKGDG